MSELARYKRNSHKERISLSYLDYRVAGLYKHRIKSRKYKQHGLAVNYTSFITVHDVVIEDSVYRYKNKFYLLRGCEYSMTFLPGNVTIWFISEHLG